jgi:hypothetical protein
MRLLGGVLGCIVGVAQSAPFMGSETTHLLHMTFSTAFPKRRTFVAAMLTLITLTHHPVSAQTTYTWTNTAGDSLNWSTGTNWSGAAMPSPMSSDSTDFSTVNLATNTVLTMDDDRTLAFGNLNAWGGFGKNVAFTGNGTLTTPYKL